MQNLFLIAHKVRGEPAFDVAAQVECAVCYGRASQEFIDGPVICTECDSTGYWWIIPTSGHRAYPWWSEALEDVTLGKAFNIPEMPPNWPDHYVTKAAPARPAFLEALLANKPAKSSGPPINRRGF